MSEVGLVSVSNIPSVSTTSKIFEKISILTNARNAYCPENGALVPRNDQRKGKLLDYCNWLLSSSYSAFCWDAKVLRLTGYNVENPVYELSSGNNSLGCFKYLVDAWAQYIPDQTYHLSNYSGGRGDYFTLQHIARIESLLAQTRTGINPEYDVSNLCLTFGGQGAYSALATYFRSPLFGERPILFTDSNYCANYRPFLEVGNNVVFSSSDPDTFSPSYEKILESITTTNPSAIFLSGLHNPNGLAVLSASQIYALVKELHERNIHLVLAEVYKGMQFADNDPHHTFLKAASELHYKKLIRVSSLSKNRGLAGFRAGWIIANPEVTQHVLDFNDGFAYNPSLIVNMLIVLSLYLDLLILEGDRLVEVEQYLSGCNIPELLDMHRTAISQQKSLIYQNYLEICARFFSSDSKVVGSRLTNEKYEMIIPSGGMNVMFRCKYLADFDQVDLFRKAYLLNGLILHTSPFLFPREEYGWMRITIAHPLEEMRRGLNLLEQFFNLSSEMELLPRNSLKVAQNE